LRLGSTLEEARAELERISGLDAEDLLTYFVDAEGFSLKGAARAERYVRSAEVLDKALPAVAELASLGWTELQQRRLDQQERERREELRASITRLSDEMIQRVLGSRDATDGGWRAAVSALHSALTTSETEDAFREAAETRVRQLTEASTTLQGCLDTPPSHVVQR
jgi:predicted RNase H-like HicB family nuclease